MGRHTDTDDPSVHPLVGEGLARRAGELGWPAEPHDGKGLGWPGDLSADGDDEPADTAA